MNSSILFITTKKSRNMLAFALVLLLAGGCASNSGIDSGRSQIAPLSSPGQSPGPASPETGSESYIIRKGDEVQISVWGYAEFNTTTTVKEAGTIAVPLVGELKIEGMTIEQSKKLLRKRLAEFVQGDIKLTFTVSSAAGDKITVLGSVVKQESYPSKTEVTLLEALSMAGGTTPDSDLRHVRIYAAGGDDQYPVEVDLAWYMENGGLNRLPMVRPGDAVYIPKKDNVIRDFSDFARDVIVLFGFFRIFN